MPEHHPRILITGADGFVGSHLMRLLSDGDQAGEIKSIGRTTTDNCFQADITDAVAVDAVVRQYRPDIVYHLAGYASVAQSATDTALTWQVNFGGTLNLAAAMAAHSPFATMLHVSTSEVYGRNFNNGPVDEDTPVAPASAYARAKAAAEVMLGDVYPASGKLIVVRPFNHTGPGQDERFVVPSFAAQVARVKAGTQDAIMVGNLEAQREFLDVRDVVRAYVMLTTAAPKLLAKTVFTIASGHPRKISDVLAQLQKAAGSDAVIRTDPARLRGSDIPLASGSAHKIHEAIGWVPEIPFERTLHDVLQAVRSVPDNA